MIGLTVVALGTSAPELAVNAMAAARETGEIAFGNLMGSNLANVGLIVGTAAIVRPLAIQGIIITREIPMMLLASMAAFVMGLDWIHGDSESVYDRSDALILLLFFAVFMYYTIGDLLRERPRDPLIQQLEQRRIRRYGALLKSLGAIVAGLVVLTLGGHFTIEGAVGVARARSVPESVVGLSIIAIGTSLPELTTSIIAARRNETDLAIGNVVGSNIFNLLFVLPISSLIRPVPVPSNGLLDLSAIVAVAGLLWIVCSAYGLRRIGRTEGWLFLVGYVGFLAARIA